MNRGLQLSLRMGPMNPAPVPAAVIDALSEVQVSSSVGAQSGFQLKFTLGKQSTIARTLLPSGYFDPRRRVIITVILNGTPTVLMDGIITKQDMTPGAGPGQSTLTVTGLDISALMDFIDLTGIPYPAMPLFAIVNLVLAKYLAFGVVPLVTGWPNAAFSQRPKFSTSIGTTTSPSAVTASLIGASGSRP